MWNFNPNTAYLDLVWYKILQACFSQKQLSGAYPLLQLSPSIIGEPIRDKLKFESPFVRNLVMRKEALRRSLK